MCYSLHVHAVTAYVLVLKCSRISLVPNCMIVAVHSSVVLAPWHIVRLKPHTFASIAFLYAIISDELHAYGRLLQTPGYTRCTKLLCNCIIHTLVSAHTTATAAGCAQCADTAEQATAQEGC
jgi:hypothetical protein